LAGAFVRNEVTGPTLLEIFYELDKNFINDFRPKIEALTTADIQRVAAKYFDTYRAAIVIVGDWEKVKDQVTPFGEVTIYDAEGNVVSKS
jgi:hypothetical protein